MQQSVYFEEETDDSQATRGRHRLTDVFEQTRVRDDVHLNESTRLAGLNDPRIRLTSKGYDCSSSKCSDPLIVLAASPQ